MTLGKYMPMEEVNDVNLFRKKYAHLKSLLASASTRQIPSKRVGANSYISNGVKCRQHNKLLQVLVSDISHSEKKMVLYFIAIHVDVI